MQVVTKSTFSAGDVSRIIEMAWEDRTPFEAISALYGLSEAETIVMMRQQLKRTAFKRWRARVSGRTTKHRQRRGFAISKTYCPTQYKQR